MGSDCDVLVIGAGPGGGSAALHAARKGLSVMMVEDHPKIGTPVHCGECLSLLAVQNLGLDLPDSVIALECKGIRVIFPDGTARLLSEEGFVLEKHLFERWIADEAISAGAELHLGHKVTNMARNFNSENKFSNWKIDILRFQIRVLETLLFVMKTHPISMECMEMGCVSLQIAMFSDCKFATSEYQAFQLEN